MTFVTLVTGDLAATREASIAAIIDPAQSTALILEGLSENGLDESPNGHASPPTLSPSPRLTIVRIAPGCICCTGNLTMRVYLNRILRHPPNRILISLANNSHLEQIRRFLSEEPYNKLLILTKDIHA